MKTFLNNKRPLITVMLSSRTEEDLFKEINDSIEQGADAFCFMMESLPEELRTREKITAFFCAMGDKPIYVSCYERNDCVKETDDERASYLLLALECGATVADVRGDMFRTVPGELTDDSKAVEKQKELIGKIHEMGKEALMSSHLLYDDGFRFVSTDRALEIASEHRSRGADISKIVTCADNEEELYACFESITVLRKKVGIPTLFLCNGQYALRHRTACGLIYEPIVFVKEKRYAVANTPQVPIENMVSVFKTAGYI